MRIKHFIITRFLNNEHMNLGNRIFDKDLIENGIRLLKTYVLKSLQNQSNKDFTLIILIHPNVNKDYIKELYALSEDFNIIVDSQFQTYLNDAYNEYDYIITSRIDYDDMIYYNGVNDIQKSINENLDKPIYCYAFKYGYMYIEDKDIYLEFDKNYENGGGISIMISLIIDCHKINKALNIYNFSHVETANNIINNYQKYGISELNYYPRVLNEKKYTFVYVRHNNTDSNYGKDMRAKVIDFNNNFFGNTIKTAICAIGRLENNYIKEWVDHYEDIGIDKIFLYDNNYDGEEYFEDAICDYIKSGFVELIDYRNQQVCQVKAYNECYNKEKNHYDWIGFFDIDEFLILENYQNIKDFLLQKKFDDCDGIKINWKQFTDSGLIRVENGNYNCKDRFFETIPDNKGQALHCKVIVKGNRDILFSDAHGCYEQDLVFKNSLGEICTNKNMDIDRTIHKEAWLNHYRYKTIQEFIDTKLKRFYPDKTKEEAIKKGFCIDTFFETNKRTKEKEDFIETYLKK